MPGNATQPDITVKYVVRAKLGLVIVFTDNRTEFLPNADIPLGYERLSSSGGTLVQNAHLPLELLPLDGILAALLALESAPEVQLSESTEDDKWSEAVWLEATRLLLQSQYVGALGSAPL